MAWHVGLAGLLESFQAMGLWIIPYLLLRALPSLLYTVAWMACFSQPQPHVRLWQFWLVRLAGSASEAVVPTATIGGEVVKVMLLEPCMPREQALASVVIDKASATTAKMGYLALGMVYLMQQVPLPRRFLVRFPRQPGHTMTHLSSFCHAQVIMRRVLSYRAAIGGDH